MFSIIIPTYNRSDNLDETLNAYLQQTSPELIEEIIIIDDGSEDVHKQKNKNIIDNFIENAPFNIKYFYRKNKGPAEARNYGINNALGDVILLTGDDIVPHRDLVKEHFFYHKKFDFIKNISVLGRIRWPIEKKFTTFMKFINEKGLQFGYSIIDNENNVPYTFFYTSNISIHRRFLLEDKLFDTEFPYAAWEDIELAYRMKNRGLKIVYNKNAIGYHNHEITFDSFRKRQERAGYAANIFCHKHPQLKDLLRINPKYSPSYLYKLAVRLAEIFCLFTDKYSTIGFPVFYDLVLNYYYQNGVKNYLLEHPENSS
jgi:glycosyltransferase involved in cell wall biosynthesis